MGNGYDMHLIPAYGRDYKSQAAVKAAWESGADFMLHGRYCSSRDKFSGQVWIRYDKQRKMVRVR